MSSKCLMYVQLTSCVYGELDASFPKNQFLIERYYSVYGITWNDKGLYYLQKMTLALRLETGIFLISFQAFYTVLNVRENRLSAKLITITSWTLSAFGVFLVRIFPHLNWIWRDTLYLFVFSPNAGKYGPEKLRIQALFT